VPVALEAQSSEAGLFWSTALGSPEWYSTSWNPMFETVTPTPLGTVNAPAQRFEFRLCRAYS
jgi:hypothetical protein